MGNTRQKIKNIMDNIQPWYKGGLVFECQRCGRCCRGEPGVVWVNKREMDEIAKFLGITRESFARSYLRSINGRYSLIEYGSGDCIMYDNGCRIYSVRPCQCRTFPFWTSNLENREGWEKLKKTCPGVGKGRLHAFKTIQENLKIYESRFG
ncbi:MAG: YkgJ family cysteine cluster protein [Candidatus Brocadiales bacterium]|nr:YkgJ family cysteine cluster protein [Planctomycetota bacterium]MDO8130692.1 YkgJ family cysteine cluster protein [Candidatus Brocadiales bacterium]